MARRERAISAGHRPGRARHCRADPARRTRHAGDRAGGDAVVRADRRDAGRGGRLLRRGHRRPVDAGDGSLPAPAQLPVAAGAGGGVRFRPAHRRAGDRPGVMAAGGAPDAVGVPDAQGARIRPGGPGAGHGRPAPDLPRNPAQRLAARQRVRQRHHGHRHPAGKRAGFPEPVRPQRAFLGQPHRRRPGSPPGAMVRIRHSRRCHPADRPGDFAGGAGDQRRPQSQAETLMTELLRIQNLTVDLPAGADPGRASP
ncbi:hypothetical protein G6F57_017986 [Rhizopus arrhizus]|nr:hypothetical protein G6F57_017986 [Rhizopus arrhizus]